MENRMIKLYSKNSSVPLRAVPGHFATGHSHVNYYIDMTALKARISEATDVARTLVAMYHSGDVIDTIACLEGTEVIGTLMAEEFARAGYRSMNAHDSVYIVTPEHNNNGQLIFRENLQPMIRGKNVLILVASVTTGITVRKMIECTQYYGGTVAGACAIFSAAPEIDGQAITSVFTADDVPGYKSWPSASCELCRGGCKLDAIVNSYGYSKF